MSDNSDIKRKSHHSCKKDPEPFYTRSSSLRKGHDSNHATQKNGHYQTSSSDDHN